jgi:pantothenate kinase
METKLQPTEQIETLIQALTQKALASEERFILGIVGPPGSGKSTLAEYVSQNLPSGCSVVVPMDGFHLANSVIQGTELQARKGAIDTFDSYGFLTLVQRIRSRREPIIYAPAYTRAFEEPIASSIPILKGTKIVIIEGNYLLSDEDPWNQIKGLLDETWFLDVDQDLRLKRLISRHIKFGKTDEEAVQWVHSSDEKNALLISASQSRADVVVQVQ